MKDRRKEKQKLARVERARNGLGESVLHRVVRDAKKGGWFRASGRKVSDSEPFMIKINGRKDMHNEKLKPITEEMEIHKEWYEEAKEVTVDSIADFIKRLTEEYSHDYGTICHAVAASAIAAACAVDKSKTGGITGFQSGCIMWEFIRNWNHQHNKTGLRLVDYDNMLYPQYADKYEKKITPHTWDALQKEAKSNVEKSDSEYLEYVKKREQYKKDIKDFVKKYPDYYEKKDRYDHIGIGTAAEWDAEQVKKDSGFEFAPQEPYEPVIKKVEFIGIGNQL